MELPTTPDLIELDADEMAAVNGGSDGPPIVDIWTQLRDMFGWGYLPTPPVPSTANMC